MLCRVRATPGVVSLEACPEVGGDAGVEARRVVSVLEDVHDTLRCCPCSREEQLECRARSHGFPKESRGDSCGRGSNRHGGNERLREILRSEGAGDSLTDGPPSLAHHPASYGGHPSRTVASRTLLAGNENERGGWPATRSSLRFRRAKGGGPDRDRTGDLMNAIHARSQLRYWPTRELLIVSPQLDGSQPSTLLERNMHLLWGSQPYARPGADKEHSKHEAKEHYLPLVQQGRA